MVKRKTSLALLASLLLFAAQPLVASDPAAAATKKVKTPTVKTRQYGPNTTKSTPFGATTGDYADFLQRVGADLDAFWGSLLPTTYRQSYNGLLGFYPYTSVSLPPSCGRVRIPSYQVIEGNAFYCRESDYIAFDNEELFPTVYEEFGASALGVILAHEFGHAIQARTGTQLRGALNETQADCFSGAWLKRVSTGGSPTVSIPLEDLDTILQAVLTFRDTPGTGSTVSGAHGTGFDRIAGLQLGYDFGAARCAAFTTNPPVLVAKNFEGLEAANQGNVPYADALEISIRTTAQHFSATFPELANGAVFTATDPASVAAIRTTCPNATTVFADLLGLCPGDATHQASVLYSADRMKRVYDRFGDAAVGYVYALGYASLLEMAQGRDNPSTSTAGETRAICLAATWYRWFGVGDRETLSSGDLDEGIYVALGLQGVTTSFDRVRALRSGFDKGPSAC
jgi:predicted metalloprotease